jgi:Glucose / Sorbosone dehydrogenase
MLTDIARSRQPSCDRVTHRAVRGVKLPRMRGMPTRLPTLFRRLGLAFGTLAVVLTAGTAPASAAVGLRLSLVQSGFNDPVLVTNAGDSRLFVVEQTGQIEIVGGGTFLDISSKIACCGERGLLGLAFHPNYAQNGLLYVYYTRAGDGAAVVAEYHVSAGDPNVADPASERIVLSFAEPYTNHNGGWLGFKGKNLYISTGDGGSAGDPQNNAQNIHSYLGKILRINPLDPDGNGPRSYSIPRNNPYVGRPGLNVIWARGMRNPWRCSFDYTTGKLWCGDVGQASYEEIDRVKTSRSYNFGWRLLEGRHYYSYPGRTRGKLCKSGCRKLPIIEYAHSDFGGGNCAVTGGYVSRRLGAALYGNYIFGDYCSGKVWVVPANFKRSSALPAPYGTGYTISAFGEGADGRLYLVDYGRGAIYQLTDS